MKSLYFQCTKAVEDSINELVNFVRSLVNRNSDIARFTLVAFQDPQDICVQLKYCNETLLKQFEPMELTSSDSVMSVSRQMIFERLIFLVSLL